MKPIIALLLITVLGGVVDGAEACTCLPEPAPEEAVRMATAVFEGVAIDKWMTMVSSEDAIGHVPVTIYRFQVVRGWKGVTGPDVRLLQGIGGCDVDFFAIGNRYLVFATTEQRPTRLMAIGCMPHRRGAEIWPYAAHLGSPAVMFANADRLTVAPSLPLIRRLRAYLVVGLVVCSKLSSLEWRWLLGDPTAEPRLSHAAEAPLRIAWWNLVASGTVLCGGLEAFVRRRRRLALALSCVAVFTVVIGMAYSGEISIRTNVWLASTLLWKER